MALTRVHTVNASGALVDTHLEGPGAPDDDEDPTVGMPRGTRVTKIGAGGEMETSGSPTREELDARKAAMAAAPKPRRAAPIAKTEPAAPALSDRRLCLELAVKTAGDTTDPAAIIEIARQYAAFIEGAP
jgi:hypothetical protein